MRAFIKDQLTQRRGGRPDRSAILAAEFDGPAGVTPMTGRQVIRHRRKHPVNNAEMMP
jgi:hypothetical protein